MEDSKCFNLDSQAVMKTDDTIQAQPQISSDINIVKQEFFVGEPNIHITIKQEVLEDKSIHVPSDINTAVKEELIHNSPEFGLLGEHVVIKDELILTSTDQELLVDGVFMNDLSFV